LPKTFLAVNLSYAFTFQEKQNQIDNEGLEMKPADHGKGLELGEPVAAAAESADADAAVAALTPKDTMATAEAPKSEIVAETATSEEPPKSEITFDTAATTSEDQAKPDMVTETATAEDQAKPDMATETATAEDQAKPAEGQGGDGEGEHAKA
jgi:hypothetical protein